MRRSLKLIDFGLTLPAAKDFMQPGNRTGTPIYMAPEIIRRRSTDPARGYLRPGYVRLPAVAPSSFLGRSAKTRRSRPWQYDTDPPRRLQDPAGLNPELAAAIMKCLEANPNRRPQTASDFLHLIRGVETEEG